MHNSQKPKSNVCFENWITKTRSSFYFLPINAQTNISFNLFFWEWTFLDPSITFRSHIWSLETNRNQSKLQPEGIPQHSSQLHTLCRQGCRYRRSKGAILANHKRGGGADYAHQITTRPPSPRIFRPSYGPARPHCTVSSLCKLLHVHSKQCHIYGTPRTSIFIQRSEKNTSPSIRSLDLHGHIAT